MQGWEHNIPRSLEIISKHASNRVFANTGWDEFEIQTTWEAVIIYLQCNT